MLKKPDLVFTILTSDCTYESIAFMWAETVTWDNKWSISKTSRRFLDILKKILFTANNKFKKYHKLIFAHYCELTNCLIIYSQIIVNFPGFGTMLF